MQRTNEYPTAGETGHGIYAYLFPSLCPVFHSPLLSDPLSFPLSFNLASPSGSLNLLFHFDSPL